MDISEKIRALLQLRGLTPAQLRAATGISRATMSRIMQRHTPAPATLERIAAVLEVSPGYLRGEYQLPAWLTEEDILFLADMRNLPYIKMVRELAVKGLTAEELRKLLDILTDIH